MAKFDTSEENSFVHVATHGGEIMMVTAVRDGLVPRYDLLAISGIVHRNIGEYELTKATQDEVEGAMAV